MLFDIGGVLITLDGVPSLAKLLEIDESDEDVHALWMTSPAVVAHETGRMSAAEFASGVVADLNLRVTADVFLQDFCQWPKAIQDGAFELLEDIPPRYRVAALSNTSAVHWDRIIALGLAERFELTYLSHEIGYMKPAPEAYLIALKGMAVPPSEVLFLDDGLSNVKAARSLGLHAHVARDPQEARSVLEEYGVISVSANLSHG